MGTTSLGGHDKVRCHEHSTFGTSYPKPIHTGSVEYNVRVTVINGVNSIALHTLTKSVPIIYLHNFSSTFTKQ